MKLSYHVVVVVAVVTVVVVYLVDGICNWVNHPQHNSFYFLIKSKGEATADSTSTTTATKTTATFLHIVKTDL